MRACVLRPAARCSDFVLSSRPRLLFACPEPSRGDRRHNCECSIICKCGSAFSALRLPALQGCPCANLHGRRVPVCARLRADAGMILLLSALLVCASPPYIPTPCLKKLSRQASSVSYHSKSHLYDILYCAGNSVYQHCAYRGAWGWRHFTLGSSSRPLHVSGP